MKRKATREFGKLALFAVIALLLASLVPLTPTVSAEPSTVTVTEITFGQLDWFGPDGSLAQADSLYGQMGWSYDPDPTTTYYLNVNVALTSGGPASWVTQNLPLFAVDNDDFSTRSEGVYFNLAELGLTAGTDLSQIYYSVTVDSTIRTTDPGPAVAFAVVETLERRATDSPDESPDPGPFVDPGEPEGVKLDAAPAKQNKARDVKGVQEGNSKCCAGAFARSIDWLNRKHKLGMTKNAQQIYDDLIAAGVSQPGLGGPNSRDEWIERKNQYARAQTGKRIVTKVWERTASTVDETEGVNQETGDFANWLKREIKSEDVEVAYFYPGNAHIVTVLEVYTKGGDTYVKYRDDEEQSDNTKGDGKGGAKYPAVKHARIYKKNGKYHFESDKNTIYFAVSESVPAVGGIAVPVDKLGLLAPYIGLASTILVATGVTAIYAKRVKRRKEKG